MEEKDTLQKLKILREKLSIPLDVAMQLLKENDGDVFICEQEFHKNNLNTICRLAECDEIIAKKYYQICNFDIEKSIKKIHQRLFFLTTTPKETIDKIGFILWAENERLDTYVTSRDRSLFIQTKDFDYIIDAFKSVFPIIDQKGTITDKHFSTTSSNFFDNKTSRIIVNRMSRIKTKNPNVEAFLRDLIKWFNIQLRYADTIVVYGNL
ncbi:hypothetical protein [Aquimarina sp. SS2-1]|uniref:hypothetical protein n=1 Tax=Aquimarina besae TaxID=3342247 RepID=UPI00366C2B29